MRDKLDCPVCANIAPHYSNDGGETWQCELCMAVHDEEARLA
jgi:ribosomal protein L37AE/L43A